MKTTKVWVKPAIDVTNLSHAQFHDYANADNGGALRTKKNQPS